MQLRGRILRATHIKKQHDDYTIVTIVNDNNDFGKLIREKNIK